MRRTLTATLLAVTAAATLLLAATPAPAAAATDLIKGPDGRQLFMYGVNLGNVKFLPFSRATQYSQSPAELRAILEGALRDISETGANTVRFWLHIDGSSSPDFGPDGLVSGLPPDLLPDLKWFLQKVHDNRLVAIISLWSHDILAVRRCNPVEHRERALRIFEEDGALKAYVDKALKPMLTELGTAKMADGRTTFSKAIAAWEIFNEPEEAAFDLEGNTDYMYKGAWGDYKYNNPAAFNADPRRAVDYQNISFLYSEGFVRVDPNEPGDADYNGFYFVKTWQDKVRMRIGFSFRAFFFPFFFKGGGAAADGTPLFSLHHPTPFFFSLLTHTHTRTHLSALSCAQQIKKQLHRTTSTGTCTTTSLASSTRITIT
jgi:hypothetical protein